MAYKSLEELNKEVEKFGTQRMENLEKEEVITRLQQFKALTQFDIELS